MVLFSLNNNAHTKVLFSLNGDSRIINITVIDRFEVPVLPMERDRQSFVEIEYPSPERKKQPLAQSDMGMLCEILNHN